MNPIELTRFVPAAAQTGGAAPRLDLEPLVLRRPQRSGLEALVTGPAWRAARPLADLAGLALAVALAAPAAPVAARPALLLFVPLALLLLLQRGTYAARLRPLALDRAVPVLGALALAAAGCALASAYAGSAQLPATALGQLLAVAVAAVGGGRLGILRLERASRERELTLRPTLIVGAGAVGAKVARRLRDEPGYGLQPVGFLDATPPSGEEGRELPVLGTPDDLEWVAHLTGAEHVVLAFTAQPDAELAPIVARCHELGLRVTVVPRLFDAVNHRLSYEPLGGLPLMGLRHVGPRSRPFAVKHALDRLVAAAVLVAILPLFAALMAAVKLSSPGPVFFRQRRVGRDGKPFDVLKFRSMRADVPPAEGFVPVAGSAPGGVEGVDRRTPIGKLIRRTSLDELPQLLNVLRGEMSLVGPRPERPEFVERFEADIERYGERHRVKAGITGWAQVHGLRGKTSLQDRVEWDNFYIEHWSLALDLKILLLTVRAVFDDAE
jgi:exopolysaccharide biosynthesis polyprenyl glycosylphosphotransferase